MMVSNFSNWACFSFIASIASAFHRVSIIFLVWLQKDDALKPVVLLFSAFPRNPKAITLQLPHSVTSIKSDAEKLCV
jgi:hypothetical protein